MTARRRKWILATTLLVLAAAVWWCFGPGEAKMEVKLVFMGYTNLAIRSFSSPDGENGQANGMPTAQVLATNSGTVTVILHPSSRTGSLVWVDGSLMLNDQFDLSSGRSFPAILKPRATMLFGVSMADSRRPWSTKVVALRYGLKDRLLSKAWETDEARIHKLLSEGSLLPVFRVVTLGPITNIPPDSARSHPPRVARP